MAIAPRTTSTIVTYVLPARSSRVVNFLQNLLLILLFSSFLALCAQVSFHIPTTPIPVTLQTLGVLLIGAALGSKRGALVILAYLAEGAAGLPVFSGGSAGLSQLLGYTGGYLVAFVVAAFVVGLLCERGMGQHVISCAIAMVVGSLIIYAIGFPWFATVVHLDLYHGFLLGVAPFLLGDLIKLVVATALLPTAWALVRWIKPDQSTSR